ncbi:putative leader peptide [Streptomonospora sp. PA3]|uniref:putative leader peptide n=1 Tax=Streptomonospora sp. PA3 TaxID=2607326 RepID=UPI003742ADC3
MRHALGGKPALNSYVARSASVRGGGGERAGATRAPHPHRRNRCGAHPLKRDVPPGAGPRQASHLRPCEVARVIHVTLSPDRGITGRWPPLCSFVTNLWGLTVRRHIDLCRVASQACPRA